MNDTNKKWFWKSYFVTGVFLLLLAFAGSLVQQTQNKNLFTDSFNEQPLIETINQLNDPELILYLMIFLGISLIITFIFWGIIWLFYSGLIISAVYLGFVDQIIAPGEEPFFLIFIIAPPLFFYLYSKSIKKEKILGTQPSFTILLSTIMELLAFALF
jgi:hypothetical protein